MEDDLSGLCSGILNTISPNLYLKYPMYFVLHNGELNKDIGTASDHLNFCLSRWVFLVKLSDATLHDWPKVADQSL